MLSRESEYAIQTMLHMASKDNDDYLFIRRIAEELNIPFFYLSKILLKLVKAGLLHSHKGPKGGVKFAVDPCDITIYRIIEIIDGDGIFTKCVLGLPECGGEHPCAVHDQWGKLRGELTTMFSDKSLRQLAEEKMKTV